MKPVYDPSAAGAANGNIFSLPHSYDDASVILLPIPWDVTTSYADGTSNGPATILKASSQLDLHDNIFGMSIWEYGAYMMEAVPQLHDLNTQMRPLATECILWMEQNSGQQLPGQILTKLHDVNKASETLNQIVRQSVENVFVTGKSVGIVGGDHSVNYGMLQAMDDHFEAFGILQIDAHADLRKSYEGFTYSHASTFFNALDLKSCKGLTQVGIRDICPAEMDLIGSDERISCFFDSAMKQRLFKGETWDLVCSEIINTLPNNVYISFDIDGLDPVLCPNTGTPVPGGLQFSEAVYLIQQVVKSGRKIIGFDLCEVSPGRDENNEWDGNVGARILLHLCNALAASTF